VPLINSDSIWDIFEHPLSKRSSCVVVKTSFQLCLGKNCVMKLEYERDIFHFTMLNLSMKMWIPL
jgi:hypothetical protein